MNSFNTIPKPAVYFFGLCILMSAYHLATYTSSINTRGSTDLENDIGYEDFQTRTEYQRSINELETRIDILRNPLEYRNLVIIHCRNRFLAKKYSKIFVR